MEASNLEINFGMTSGVRRTINDKAETPPPVRAVISAPCSAVQSNFRFINKFIYLFIFIFDFIYLIQIEN